MDLLIGLGGKGTSRLNEKTESTSVWSKLKTNELMKDKIILQDKIVKLADDFDPNKISK